MAQGVKNEYVIFHQMLKKSKTQISLEQKVQKSFKYLFLSNTLLLASSNFIPEFMPNRNQLSICRVELQGQIYGC